MNATSIQQSTNSSQTNNRKPVSNNIIKDISKTEYIFGDFGGLILKKNIRTANLAAWLTISVFIFALIYYYFMIDFDKNFFIPGGFSRKSFLKHQFLIALFMSINFQSTTAYVDLKCKSFWVRVVIMSQIVSTFAISFIFLL